MLAGEHPWPEFVAHILALRINASVLLGCTRFTVGDMFCGGKFFGGLEDHHLLELGPIEVIHSKSEITVGRKSLCEHCSVTRVECVDTTIFVRPVFL